MRIRSVRYSGSLTAPWRTAWAGSLAQTAFPIWTQNIFTFIRLFQNILEKVHKKEVPFKKGPFSPNEPLHFHFLKHSPAKFAFLMYKNWNRERERETSQNPSHPPRQFYGQPHPFTFMNEVLAGETTHLLSPCRSHPHVRTQYVQ